MTLNRSCVERLILISTQRSGFIMMLFREYTFGVRRRGLRILTRLNAKQLPEKREPDALANGTNAVFVERLYSQWSQNPKSVEESWDAYFSGKRNTSSVTVDNKKSFKAAGSSTALAAPKPSAPPAREVASAAAAAPASAPADFRYIDDHLVVQAIIRAYQSRGHLAADLDPLGIVGPTGGSSVDGARRNATQAVLRQHYSYVFNDLNTSFKLPSSTKIGGTEQFLTLKEILDRLERIYCGHMGLEYMQILSFNKCDWIREQFELPNAVNFSADEKKLILERLTRSTGFENFLAKKFTSEKRFGLEGCDIMIPVMKEIIDRSTNEGVESFFIGMAHRGRLNVLANVCRKPIPELLAQFHGLKARESGSGDVKYHLGVFSERLNRKTNRNVRITVVANPSHLEHVNPVMLGKARAEMYLRGDYQGNKVLPILIHGDASFCGQGIVFESIHLSDLPAYTTFGTIHIVVNNQVGFTTDPRFSRSSRYCTDVARVVNAPILHVNADDPEACIHCARVAAAWRAKYKKDVVIDIVGYRRNGHNEADEPMFTQPLMYQRIRKVKPVMVQYAEKLIREGIITDADYKEMQTKYEKICNDGFEESKKMKSFSYSAWIDSPWSGYFEGRDRLKMCPTGVSVKTLEHIGNVYSSPPPSEHKFEVHKGILRILGLRKKMVEAKIADWSLGEAFAIGSLLKDGVHVRVSGQDVERGTFSHRHHVLHHQTQDKTWYNSLQHLYPDQAPYHICNSSLSENAVLAFDHGYSMASPNSVVIWEAQFGDFVNTAQAVIDTFIASGETKWVRQSGMVMFLPHSMEGMGPEHSSGRIERFLQLSDDDQDVFPDTNDSDFVARQIMNVNWIVTNLTTPANLFHALRRQVAMGFRKPLINFSPKSVLRHPLARSPFKDFNECSEFNRIIIDEKCERNPDCVKKLVFCSGKVYYDLFKEREDHEQAESVALVRVEQLSPFPYDLILKQFQVYKNAEILWAQEEHKNQGGWSYVQPRFETALIKCENETRCISYHGRQPNSSPSTGNKVQHYNEYKALITSIFGELTEDNKKRMERIVKEQQQKAKSETAASMASTKTTKGKEAAPAAAPAGKDAAPAGKDAAAAPKAAAAPAKKEAKKAARKPVQSKRKPNMKPKKQRAPTPAPKSKSEDNIQGGIMTKRAAGPMPPPEPKKEADDSDPKSKK
ncbi:2-oxoglutarate dehydrogenase, mitochondrial [Drosophila busckii]|uniref:2-oxoglutarate dehydrogenase, mitochondrial n=1 Tax=Drosophila busckii TaxID=30019 RepID=UPI00083F02FB|nr:2-oxoglutarate dehydrogenase, mitochondrial [Drosophila busckii]